MQCWNLAANRSVSRRAGVLCEGNSGVAASEADLLETFRGTVRVLESCNIDYAVIGGLARAAWGRVRATTDVDITISADAAALATTKRALERAGFHVEDIVAGDEHDARPDIFAATLLNRVRVDFLVAKTPFEQEAMARRQRIELLGETTYVVSVEDLVFYKLLATRPRDWDDVLDVLETQTHAGRIIDWVYLERHAGDWGINETLARLRRELPQ